MADSAGRRGALDQRGRLLAAPAKTGPAGISAPADRTLCRGHGRAHRADARDLARRPGPRPARRHDASDARDRRQDAVRRRAGRRSRDRRRVARSGHEPLHEPDALVPLHRLSAASLDPTILAGDPADRRDHLRDHPAPSRQRPGHGRPASRACWPRATSRGEAA